MGKQPDEFIDIVFQLHFADDLNELWELVNKMEKMIELVEPQHKQQARDLHYEAIEFARKVTDGYGKRHNKNNKTDSS